jgi:ABC-type transport system involved in multi-copper enzyme maturation permease subunit
MQPSSWFYDFKRTLTSKATVIIAAAIVLIQGAITYVDFSAYTTGPVDSSGLIGNSIPTTVVYSLALNTSGGDGLLISLLVILAAFIAFGNERIKGVLDYVLAQPVSRIGLVLSRYLAILCAVALAAIGSFLIIDIILQVLNGSSFSLIFILTTIFTYVGEIASLLAIVFIISYLVKSSGVLLGFGLGLWFSFTILWQYVINGVAGLIGANPGNGNAFSASYIHVSIISYFLNPVELSYLAYVFAMKWFEMNTPIDPASYGVSLFSMIVAVAL